MSESIEHEGAQQAREAEACVPTASRTLVIVTSQVVVIVALVVLWSLLRRRRAGE